ncbi:MAG: ribosome recycling factor [Actinomycetota bacterium]|nr:ribosome recycling factor [Actinomycetota bacterium]
MAETKDEVLREADEKMQKAVSVNREDLGSIRSGRATPALLNRISIEYYGAHVPLNTVANISVPEPRLIVIAPYDASSIAAIEKAILSSDLGVNPNNDGNVIRLSFPELTEDRRKELTKLAHQRAEEGRIAVRGVRRHAKQELERMKKDHSLSEDEERGAEGQLQKLTDKHVAEVDENLKRKEAELAEI